jgi:hypothetical protein
MPPFEFRHNLSPPASSISARYRQNLQLSRNKLISLTEVQHQPAHPLIPGIPTNPSSLKIALDELHFVIYQFRNFRELVEPIKAMDGLIEELT